MSKERFGESVKGSPLPDIVAGVQPIPYSTPTPVELTDAILQLADEQHGEIVAKQQKLSVVDVPGVKATTFPTANAVTLMHRLNPPITDGFITVKRIYTALEVMVRNYDRSHTDEFFEAAPQLIILKDGETEDMLTTAYLRRNYRKFVKRVAHRVWHYRNAIIMYIASMANVFTMYSYFGTSRSKRLATDFKFSWINNEFNSYVQFVKPIGAEAYIQKYSTFAGASSPYGAPLISLPFWDTSIFGNASLHNMHPFNLLDATKSFIFNDEFKNKTEQDTTVAERLILNMERAIEEYGDAPDAPWQSEPAFLSNLGFTAPSLTPENGLFDNLTLDNGDSIGSSWSRDQVYQSDISRNSSSTPSSHTTRSGKLASTVVAQVYRWKKLIENDFPEFSTPGNDWYDFFTGGQFAAFTGIKLFEPSTSLSQWKSWADHRKSVNMMDLANAMVHKRDNRVSQNTIVRYVPLLHSTDPVTDNYERYDVDADAQSDQISSAQEWPTLVPNVFSFKMLADAEGEYSPEVASFVFNSIPFLNDDPSAPVAKSDIYTPDGRYMSPATMVGAHEALLDAVQAAQLDTDDSAIEMVGLSLSQAKDWAVRFDGKAPLEFPTHIFVDQAALLNTSDPLQCGFNLLLAFDDGVPSEWAKHLMNLVPSVALGSNASGDAPSDLDINLYAENGLLDTAAAGLIPVQFTHHDDYDAVPATTAIKDYMLSVMDACVFVGLNAFSLPQVIARIDSASWFRNRVALEVTHQPIKDLFDEIGSSWNQNDKVGPVGSLIAQMKHSSYLIGAGVYASPIINAFGAYSSDSGNDIKYWDTYLYSPNYPPVQPTLVPMADDYYEDFIPTFLAKNVNDPAVRREYPSWAPFASVDLSEGLGAPLNSPAEGMKQHRQRSTLNSQNAKWMWWVRCFIYRALLTGYRYTPELADNVTISSPTTGRESTALSLSSRTRVEFIGSISLPTMAQVIAEFSTESSIKDYGYGVAVGELPTIFDSQYILPEPRMDPRTRRPGSDKAYTFKAKSFGEARSQAGKILETFTAQKSSSNNNSGGKAYESTSTMGSKERKFGGKKKSHTRSNSSKKSTFSKEEPGADKGQGLNSAYTTSGNSIETDLQLTSHSDRMRTKNESRNASAGDATLL